MRRAAAKLVGRSRFSEVFVVKFSGSHGGHARPNPPSLLMQSIVGVLAVLLLLGVIPLVAGPALAAAVKPPVVDEQLPATPDEQAGARAQAEHAGDTAAPAVDKVAAGPVEQPQPPAQGSVEVHDAPRHEGTNSFA